MNIYGMKFKDILNIKITDLRKYGLSLMVTNNLIQWGYIYNFEQLLKCPEEKLYSISGIDSESVEEIKSIVTFFQIPGIHLGMSEEEISKLLSDDILIDKEMSFEEKTKKILTMSIKELNFSLKTYNCLKCNGFSFVGQLLAVSDGELLAIRNFDVKNLKEVEEKLSLFQIPGIHLGMSKKEINKFLGDQVLLEVEGLSEEYAELEQSEEETSKAELLVDEATKYRDRLLNLNHRKKEALKSLQALFEEQERLQEENRLLDEQIILLKEKLSHIKTKDNKAVDNSGKQKQL